MGTNPEVGGPFRIETGGRGNTADTPTNTTCVLIWVVSWSRGAGRVRRGGACRRGRGV